MARLILPNQSVFDLNGHPLPGAKMYFYESGTVTPKDTYSDEALTTPNANPVIADSQGQFSNIFLSGNYSCKLDDADDVTQPDYPAEIEAAADSTTTVLLTGDQTIAGVKTFTDRLAIRADTPTCELHESDGVADNRIWQLVSIAGQFVFRVANDVRDTFTGIFTVDRTGTTVDTVNFLSTNLQHNATKVLIQTDLLDEDDMISDSDTKGATQQSIKAYTDSKANQARYENFLAGGTFTVPLGVTEVFVTGTGGGGGGGAGGGSTDGAAGGAGGRGCLEQSVSVTPSEEIAITIGAGGAGGASSGADGNIGASTLFGGYITLAGGNLGQGSAGDTGGAAKGLITGAGGDSTQAGFDSIHYVGGAAGFGGGGGGGLFDDGAAAGASDVTGASAVANSGAGGGGSGGNNTPGGAGGSGKLYVRW